MIAQLALRSLSGRSLASSFREPGTPVFRRVLANLSNLLSPDNICILCGYVVSLALFSPFFPFFQASSHLYSTHWMRTGVALLSSCVLMIAFVTARKIVLAIPAVELWFICCAVSGLGREDIAATVGSHLVLKIARYLDVSDKLP